MVTQEMKPKRELIRIVRSKDGEVFIDETGKKSGRGAYLTKDKEVILLAQKKNVIEHNLKAKVDPSLYDQLLEMVNAK